MPVLDEKDFLNIVKGDAPEERPLRILAHVHMFPPAHCAGSETFLLAILRGMAKRGHQCRVIASEASHSYDIDGVIVMKPPTDPVQERIFNAEHYGWCDVAITHLNCTSQAMHGCCDAAKPLVHLVHNDQQLRFHRVRAIRAQLMIYNSDWIYETYKKAGDTPLEPSIIVHPIVEPDLYRTTPGDRVLMVSLTFTKGAEVFYELSRRLRKILFAGVIGAYGDQIRKQEEMPNVTIFEHTADIKQIYGLTKVVLMPSNYESYGRVAVEAACSGIPSIVHPTPGLKEALGDAAIYCDRDKIDDWEKEIKRLYGDPVYYAERSKAALEFANSLQPENELDRVESALKIVAKVGLSGSGSLTLDVLGEEAYLKLAKSGGYFDPASEPPNFRPPLGESSMSVITGPYIADRQLYLNSKGEVVERSDPDAQILLVGKNGEVPYRRAVELGLVGAKAQSAPSENKAFTAPLENKSMGPESLVTGSSDQSAGALIRPQEGIKPESRVG